MGNKFKKVLILCLIISFVIGLCLFIGIDFSIRTLLLIMSIDYLIGISLALIESSKHGDGTLSSKIGYKGIVKKVIVLLLVGLGAIIDDYLASHNINFAYIKDLAVVAFILNEALSIVENARLAGLKIPNIFTKLIDILNNIKFKK